MCCGPAFDCLSERQTAADIRHCMELAKRYFRGDQTDSPPIIEILCDGTATVVRELPFR